MHFATKTSTVDRLDVLGKGRRLPRLTVASKVPTIMADYCSSWLNGKRPAKRRESKIWLIIAHSLDSFIRSQLPAWKSDMAEVEIGKQWNMWQKLRTILYNSTNALTLKARVWPNRNLEPKYAQNIIMLFLWVWFFIQSSSSNLAWSLNLFVIVWADFSPNYLLSSDSWVYF